MPRQNLKEITLPMRGGSTAPPAFNGQRSRAKGARRYTPAAACRRLPSPFGIEERVASDIHATTLPPPAGTKEGSAAHALPQPMPRRAHPRRRACQTARSLHDSHRLSAFQVRGYRGIAPQSALSAYAAQQ